MKSVNTYLILSWAFFFVSVVCALLITSVRHPLTRKYRKILISTAVSGMILGVLTWFTPLLLRKVNPIQSKKISLEQLPVTHWEEPGENPETTNNLESDEMAWLKKVPEANRLKFKFKMKLDEDFRQLIGVQENQFVYLDHDGDIRGFDPYTGLNHWQINLGIKKVQNQLIHQHRLYLVDEYKIDHVRVSSIDLQSPSILWQRVFPETKETALTFDYETQSVLVSTGGNGVWSLKSKTGEILWKRPEVFTKINLIPTGKHTLAFEPPVGKKPGAWYFIDPLLGTIVQKQNHIYPEMDHFLISNNINGNRVLAQVNDQSYFLFNPNDLSVIWNQATEESIVGITLIDSQSFFVAYKNKILEKRDVQTGEIIWQKKFNQMDLKSIKLDLNQGWLVGSVDDGEQSGTGFYSLDNGEYLFTANVSDQPRAVDFFGDWLYLMSDTFIWAFQHEKTIR